MLSDVGTDAVAEAIAVPSFWLPEFLDQSAWVEHAPFAFWLVNALRPRSFVELGTHGGFSYFAICQAVRRLQLATRCHAVDTWRGDEHAGFYGEEVYERVRAHNDALYADFSSLLRATFDGAAAAFADGTIDLLHIDGRHLYQDAKHDFETWRPKLSDRAVVLFHDTNMRERDFGVFRLWHELQDQYPSFEFLHGHGLGVLGYGAEIPDDVRSLLGAIEGRVAEVRLAYARLGASLSDRLELRLQQDAATKLQQEVAERTQVIADRKHKLSELTQQLQHLDRQQAQIQSELGEEKRRRLSTEAELDIMMKRLAELRQGHADDLNALAELRAQQAFLTARLQEKNEQWRRLRRSWPWKATSVLREVDKLCKRLNGRSSRRADDLRAERSRRSAASRLGRSISKRYRKLRGLPPPPKRKSATAVVMGAEASADVASAWINVVNEYAPATPPRELALFVTHSRDGVTTRRHVEHYVDALRTEGIDVILIVASDSVQTVVPDRLLHAAAGVYIRQNLGFDFAAWAHMMQILPSVFKSTNLYIVNDSLYGPLNQAAFHELVEKVRAAESDIVGLTDSFERGWHVQSFFLRFNKTALSKYEFHSFWNNVKSFDNKQQVIDRYEVTFAREMRNCGLSVDAVFKSDSEANLTVFAWKEIIDRGFPFVKASLLRGDFPAIDLSGWEEFLEARSFNTELIDYRPAAIGASLPKVLHDRNQAQLAARIRQGMPLRVAFLGPWNYANGLGQASRGYVSALFNSGHEVSLFPIKRPFHTHARTAPWWDVRGFDGAPDIAIIHLNPDAWPGLLLEEQKAMLDKATFRIGLWVWEMSHIPADWMHALSGIDGIWTPSEYCADIFRQNTSLPVAVVPHVVRVDDQMPDQDEQARVRASLALPGDRRIILYIFDGASYLARKNPFALIRAFRASGLGDHGWQLVLKVKNLWDIPTEGQRLVDATEGDPAISILDRSSSRQELEALLATAEIYASSHCSEGFGLTIAEAMAAGKPVVATDYGGSRDFLDEDCGYPVPASIRTLDRDHGHYTKGGVWAEVDETALRDRLVEAAADIERGSTVKGQRARARIQEMLSAQSVAGSISRSFAGLVAH
jgi:glycosyltransferase involved in cell wall biosynthesis